MYVDKSNGAKKRAKPKQTMSSHPGLLWIGPKWYYSACRIGTIWSERAEVDLYRQSPTEITRADSSRGSPIHSGLTETRSLLNSGPEVFTGMPSR